MVVGEQIQLWSENVNELLGIVEQQKVPLPGLTALTFSSDGKHLATANRINTKIWIVAPTLATTGDSLSAQSLQTATDFNFDTLVVGNLETAGFRPGLNEQELPRLVLPTLARHVPIEAQANQSIDVLSDREQGLELVDGTFIHVDPWIATALRTGLVIWLIHVGQFAAALLWTATAWVQLDPLMAIEGCETVGVCEARRRRPRKLCLKKPSSNELMTGSHATSKYHL